MFRFLKRQAKIYDLERENDRLKQDIEKYNEYFSEIRTIERRGISDFEYNRLRRLLENFRAIILKQKIKTNMCGLDIFIKYRLPKNFQDEVVI